MVPPPSLGMKRQIRLISIVGPFTSPQGSQKLYESPSLPSLWCVSTSSGVKTYLRLGTVFSASRLVSSKA
jgi:hypothetical protein